MNTVAKWTGGAVAAFSLMAGSCGALHSFNIIPKDRYGVKESFGKITDRKMQPGGPYWINPVPGLEKIYKLKANTIILDLDAGEGANTQDRNGLVAPMQLHFKNNPDSGVIEYHVAEMAQDDGKQLLSGLLSQSVNTVAGRSRAANIVNNPEQFLLDVKKNLDTLLQQNNVAIELDAIQLKSLNVGGSVTQVQKFLKINPKTGEMAFVGEDGAAKLVVSEKPAPLPRPAP